MGINSKGRNWLLQFQLKSSFLFFFWGGGGAFYVNIWHLPQVIVSYTLPENESSTVILFGIMLHKDFVCESRGCISLSFSHLFSFHCIFSMHSNAQGIMVATTPMLWLHTCIWIKLFCDIAIILHYMYCEAIKIAYQCILGMLQFLRVWTKLFETLETKLCIPPLSKK